MLPLRSQPFTHRSAPIVSFPASNPASINCTAPSEGGPYEKCVLDLCSPSSAHCVAPKIECNFDTSGVALCNTAGSVYQVASYTVGSPAGCANPVPVMTRAAGLCPANLPALSAAFASINSIDEQPPAQVSLPWCALGDRQPSTAMGCASTVGPMPCAVRMRTPCASDFQGF